MSDLSKPTLPSSTAAPRGTVGTDALIDNDEEELDSEEEADLEQESTEDGGGDIAEPFDPTKIRIDTKPMTVDLLVKRMESDEIDLQPAFQRAAGLWTDSAKSRLIESLLIRIPIPAFYMDATNEDRWLVVDGLQRLTALKRFIVDKDTHKNPDGSVVKALRLQSLEYLKIYEGKQFGELPRPMQRRISEAEVVVYLIRPGTPELVKFNVFKRINTGGLPLSPQEIRHALNQQGDAPLLLQRLSECIEFKRATAGRFNDGRMTDRECVLRFISFIRTPPEQLREDRTYRDLDTFLHKQMAALNEELRIKPEMALNYEKRFIRAVQASHQLLGRYSFRKIRSMEKPRRGPVNKALFEAWTVNLDRLTDAEIDALREHKTELLEGFVALMNQREFELAVTQATGDRRRIERRFAGIRELLARVQLPTEQQSLFSGIDPTVRKIEP